MSGVYGSLLSYFPELVHRFVLYPVERTANGGYAVMKDAKPLEHTIHGIIMDGRAVTALGSGKSNSQAWLYEHNQLSLYGKKQLWTSENLESYMPRINDYGKDCGFAVIDTRDRINNAYYMLWEQLSWTFEGDFFRYEIRIIGGNNAINESDSTADDFADFLS